MPIPFTTELSEGNNVFRVAAKRLEDDSFDTALLRWRQWGRDNLGQYDLISLDFQPIPLSLTQASRAQNGGNAMQMPDGPWCWLNYLIRTPELYTSQQWNATQSKFRQLVLDSGTAKGLPLFINDANVDQNALTTFSTYQRLKKIKQTYDPTGFFSNYTGGWAFP